MADLFDFESRLEQRLLARASLASRPFDAAEIARAVAGSSSRSRRPAWRAARSTLVFALLALLLAAALVSGVVGSWHLFPSQPPLMPRLPTANGWIAVSANPIPLGGEAGDIYRVEQGVAPRRVIGADGDGIAQACPQFSPDGTRLAYGEARASDQPVTSNRGVWPVPDRAIVVVAVDRPSIPLVRTLVAPDPGPLVCPKWSPDGKSVATIAHAEIRIIDAATGTMTAIPFALVPSTDTELAWSRDSTRLAVTEANAIGVVRVADGSWDQLPTGVTYPTSPRWSADDRAIVYVGHGGGQRGSAVHVWDLAARSDLPLQLPGTKTEPLARVFAEYDQFDAERVDLSPDGTGVVWVESGLHCTPAGDCSGIAPRVVLSDLSGARARQAAIPADFVTEGVTWAPTGDRLLFSSVTGIDSVELTSGSLPTTLVRGDLNLEWSWDEVSWQPRFD